MLSESVSIAGAPESEGGSEIQPRDHHPSRQGNGASTQQCCFGKCRDLKNEATSAMSHITPAATSDRFCVLSDSDFAIDTQSTGSHEVIKIGVLPKRNRLGSCTEPIHCR